VSDLQAAIEYRAWAEQCREMAKHAARPAALIMRAQAFEAAAAALQPQAAAALQPQNDRGDGR
jgi:hypothetical protein